MTNLYLFPLLKACKSNLFGTIGGLSIEKQIEAHIAHFELRRVICKMKHLNNLLFASFGLLAILQQVQTNPRMCRYWQKVKDVDYCEDFGENHLGCNNKGVSSEI